MFTRLAFTALLSFGVAVQGVAVPHTWLGARSDGGNATVDIKSQLGPQLSKGAIIYLPQDDEFANETLRWSTYSAPTFRAVVEVTCESDVQATVRWANQYDIPFLPAGGRHGINSKLGSVQNGIEISFASMKGIDLSADGNSATLGVGLHSGEIVRGLYALNKRTTSGACLCTGVMGPLLGGGHGFLQGQHGLLADQLIEARVVLADGSAITVSEKENDDLFWGLRGAGHNFGVVTSITVKVHEQPQRNWTYFSIIAPGAAVQPMFAAAEELNKNVPAELTNYIIMRRIPDFDPDNALIISDFFYDGSPEDLAKYTAPFASVPQITNITQVGNYADIYTLGQADEASPQCIPNSFKNIYGIELNKYNPAVEQQVYNAFNAYTANPGFANSNVVYESYGRQAVLEVPDDSTAIHFRNFSYLVTAQMIYMDPTLVDLGVAQAGQLRDLIQTNDDTPELHAYVNYAFGDESMQATYGYDQWRIDKLVDLKKKYDPTGKFNHYAPITY